MLLSKSIILAITMCVAATSFADAWGPVAHDAIAFMVKDLLSDGVRNEVNNMLNAKNTNVEWGIAANWADTIRNIPAYAGTQFEHYVSIPHTPPTLTPYAPAHCVRNRCLTSGIIRAALASACNAPQAGRKDGIRFLLHYLSDASQPLHVTSYLGGANGVLALWYGKTSTNLHAVWDSFLPKTVMNNDPETFAKKLSSDLKKMSYSAALAKWGCASAPNKQLSDCVEEWINESNKEAQSILDIALKYPLSSNKEVILDSNYVNLYKTFIEDKMKSTAVRIIFYISTLLAPCATK